MKLFIQSSQPKRPTVDNRSLSYDDIDLVAGYFDGSSRSEISTTIDFGNRFFKLPVVPANMACVIDMSLATKLAELGYFYVMHRFNPPSETVNWIRKMNERQLNVSISVGVTQQDKDFIEAILAENLTVDFITIDIAHGFCRRMKDMLVFIQVSFYNRPFIIAGNVMTPTAVEALSRWGADAVKVGIAGGRACITKFKTGFHSPMFSTVQQCSGIGVDIIADGGVRHNGDIFKALVAGAKLVMVGSMFSACIDSPAATVITDSSQNISKKTYYGSASEHNKGHTRHIEGTSVDLLCNGMTYLEKLAEIREDLQSSISYSGNTQLDREISRTKFTSSC